MQLPDDPATLKDLVRDILGQLAEAQEHSRLLQQRLDLVLRRIYGRKSERIIVGGQTAFPFAEGALVDPESAGASAATTDAAPAPRRTDAKVRPGHGRGPLPAGLPRRRVVHDLAEAEKACQTCHGAMVQVGEEISEQLEYEPAKLFVIEHVRVKYACRGCADHVTTADKPAQPIEKGLPGPGLLAQVVVSKFADHLPLNRQSEIFTRSGIDLHRSTLCDWVRVGADLLAPIVGAMEARILQSRKIHTDDTPVPVLDITRDRTRTGRLWPYIGDRDHPYIVFRYTPTRSRDGPREVLRDYRGYLQADAYSGYDNLYADLPIIEAACWAHARRYFVDALPGDRARAQFAVDTIRRLYAVEDEARELSDDARRNLRQAKSQPILDKFKEWLEAEAPRVLPKSDIAQAIRYALEQWDALKRYLEDGILEIDNNRAERALRCVAVGRKNWMFAGSDEGAKRAAIHYSIIATCKDHGINPFAYMRDVFDRVSTTPLSELHTLLPDEWQRAQLERQVGTAR